MTQHSQNGEGERPGWDVDGICNDHGRYLCAECAIPAPSIAREPATADVEREGFVLMPARATRAMVDAADACIDAYEAYGKMVEVGHVR